MSRKVREVTCYLLDLMDQGVLDPTSLAEACMTFMSEAEVEEMARMNELWPGYNDLGCEDGQVDD